MKSKRPVSRKAESEETARLTHNGEGEQKIMSFIKSGEAKQNGEYPNVLIYGLDADLIILSMMLNRQKIKLLRETQNTTVEMAMYSDSEFVFFDIDRCCDALLKEYNLTAFERSRVIDDIAFVTMFGGNDFVEPFLHTKMRDNGMEKILNTYHQTLCECGVHCVDKSSVNFLFLKKWLSKLGNIEDHCVRKLQLRWSKTPDKPECSENTKMIDYQMSLYEHTLYSNKSNPFHYYYKDHHNKIDYKAHNSIWKEQYNDYYFCSFDNVCIDYLKCIKWTWKYYLNSTESWIWHYKHRNSPLCTDFVKFLNSYDEKTLNDIWKNITFVPDEPLTQFEQLLIVTPMQHNSILPYCLSTFVKEYGREFPEQFPQKFKLDVEKGGKNIYSEPVLPDIDIPRIHSIVTQCVYSEPELARNNTYSKLFCHKIA
jgi:5'-3' exonuclease